MLTLQTIIEAIVFNSRWLVAPFLIGLILGLVALVYKFMLKLFEFAMQLPSATLPDVMMGILSLVDLTLVANLILIVICSGYENFLVPIDAEKRREWP